MFFLRSPGDVSSNKYESHLPEQWCPLVTLIGFVGSQKVESASLRHFQLKTSVYDPSTAKATEFSVFCFLADGRRWPNFVIPNAGSCVSITAKVVGRVVVDKENCLAVRMLDTAYIPAPRYAQANQPSQVQPSTPSPRANRWANRVTSVTPSGSKRTHTSAAEDDTANRSSKRMHISESEDENETVVRSSKKKRISVSEDDSATHSVGQSALDYHSATTGEDANVSSKNHSRTLTPVDSDELVKVKIGGGERLLRTRRMTKK